MYSLFHHNFKGKHILYYPFHLNQLCEMRAAGKDVFDRMLLVVMCNSTEAIVMPRNNRRKQEICVT